ncbi:hypothetical protein [Poseidonocella sp. HB161398]|uniref:hypothetical protein n=1 Tax=Poseidonocella sp. HB161398 TaxID=2320855 RepID=UPI00110980D1|nr:hypothetical protein [Poseidonocella sp. HB161398]
MGRMLLLCRRAVLAVTIAALAALGLALALAMGAIGPDLACWGLLAALPSAFALCLRLPVPLPRPPP